MVHFGTRLQASRQAIGHKKPNTVNKNVPPNDSTGHTYMLARKKPSYH